MQWHEEGGLKLYTFDIFSECQEMRCATFSRSGGVSKPPFDTLNVKNGLGDDEASVAVNLKRIQEVFGYSKLIQADQVHGREVALVDQNSPPLIPKTDGLITSSSDVGLMIAHADCQAAIFYDPICHALCAVHAGWKGQVQNIYHVAIKCLEKNFGSRPENLLCGISPSLGPEASEFIHYKEELPENFWPHQTKSNHFDLWEIAYEQLIEGGLLPDHIEIARLSTYAETADFFSYRRSQRTGRNGTVAFITQSSGL